MVTTDFVLAEIGSEKDDRSFLVPAFGFEKYGQAEQFLGDPNHRVFFPGGRSYDAYRVGGKTYLPRFQPDFFPFNAGNLIRNRFEDGPMYELLRKKDTPLPDGAYNVAVLVEGPRKFYRGFPHTTKHPKWWYAFAEGLRDCYAVWGRYDDVYFPTAKEELAWIPQLYLARSGRGVIYTCEAEFGNDGKPRGYHTTIVRIEFTILDRDSTKDDVIRVKCYKEHFWFNDLEEPFDPYHYGSDNVWNKLVDRAYRGFNLRCEPIPDETEEYRKFLVDQLEKFRGDFRKAFGDSFRDKIKRLNWQEALDLVQEPWQMAVVCQKFGDDKEFSDTGGVYTVHQQTVPEMLRRYKCDNARREKLAEMIRKFVAPTDNLWSYAGD